MIGKQIKEIRKQHNLTQEAFGKKVLHTKSNVSKWESGSVVPDIATIKKISEVFSIDINILLDSKIKYKPKAKGSKLISLSQANYSGIDPLPSNQWKRVLYHLIWAGLVIGGFCLWIPLLKATTGFQMKHITYMLAGTLVIIAGAVFGIVGLRISGSIHNKNRMNVLIDVYTELLIMTSKVTGKTKEIYGNDIFSVGTAEDGREVIINLKNNKAIRIFNVDKSVRDAANNILKGGK